MSRVHNYLLPAVRYLWIFIFLLSPFKTLIAENIFYEFGPKTDKVIVFTASAGSDNQATAITLQLQKYAQKLSADAIPISSSLLRKMIFPNYRKMFP